MLIARPSRSVTVVLALVAAILALAPAARAESFRETVDRWDGVAVEATMTDEGAKELCKNIAKKIESDLRYPGRIKVTIIRETRIVEYAR